MHWLDLILIIILSFGALMGARSGFIKQIARIVTLVLAIYLCFFFNEPVMRALSGTISGMSPFGLKILSYVIIFLGVVLTGFLITWWIDKMIQAAQLKSLDRFLGAGLGALKAGLLAGVLLMAIVYFSGNNPPKDLTESKIAPVMIKGMRVVLVAVPQEYKDKINTSVERLKETASEKISEKVADELKNQQKQKPVDPLTDPLPEIPR